MRQRAERSVEPHSDVVKQMQNSSYEYIQGKNCTSGPTHELSAQLYHVLPLTVISCLIVLCLGIPPVAVYCVYCSLILSIVSISGMLQCGRNRENMLRSDKVSPLHCLRALPLNLGIEGFWGGSSK